MQLQALMFMLLMIIIMPVMLLFGNHNVFFIIMSVVVFVMSIKNMQAVFSNTAHQEPEIDDELIQEFEDSMNLNIKKFGTGAKVVKHLLVMLFFTYCMFFTNIFILQAFISIILLYYLREIIRTVAESQGFVILEKRKMLSRIVLLLINAGAIMVIILTVRNKFLS